MKLPKKFQGYFDWTVAPLAINAGHRLEIFSNGLWREKICHEAVRADERYRVRPPREFSEGWYEHNVASKRTKLIYFDGTCWWAAGQGTQIRPDTSNIGTKVR